MISALIINYRLTLPAPRRPNLIRTVTICLTSLPLVHPAPPPVLVPYLLPLLPAFSNLPRRAPDPKNFQLNWPRERMGLTTNLGDPINPRTKIPHGVVRCRESMTSSCMRRECMSLKGFGTASHLGPDSLSVSVVLPLAIACPLSDTCRQSTH